VQTFSRYVRRFNGLAGRQHLLQTLADSEVSMSDRLPPVFQKGGKTVLVIAADFSPSSYPSALRVRFLVHHLRDFGWNPVILTIQPRFYEAEVDLENEKLLPTDLEIVRTDAIPAWLTRRLRFGDVGLRSLCHLWSAMNRILREREIDLVFISVPPNATMVLGRMAYSFFGIPYVLDYQDPVVSDYYWKLPRHQRPPKHLLAYIFSRLIERFALRNVSDLSAVSKGTMDGLAKRYARTIDVTEIPLGVEPSDFEYLRTHPRTNPVFNSKDGFLHVSCVGRGGVDMLASLRAVFRAIIIGVERRPDLFGRLRLHFVGTTYAFKSVGQYQVLPLAREMKVEAFVDEHPGRVSYLTAIQILLDSHALIAIGSDATHYTASKIFPYILAARPLLAVFHEKSTVVTILKETQAGEVVEFGDDRPVGSTAEEIAMHLLKLLSFAPGVRPPTRWEAFESYTARAMSGRLASVFERAIGGSETGVSVSEFEAPAVR
jgi:hypothetical protein